MRRATQSLVLSSLLSWQLSWTSMAQQWARRASGPAVCASWTQQVRHTAAKNYLAKSADNIATHFAFAVQLRVFKHREITTSQSRWLWYVCDHLSISLICTVLHMWMLLHLQS